MLTGLLVGAAVGGKVGYEIGQNSNRVPEPTRGEATIDETSVVINEELVSNLSPERKQELRAETIQLMEDMGQFELEDIIINVSPNEDPLRVRLERKIVNENGPDHPSNIILAITEGSFRLKNVPVLEEGDTDWYHLPNLGVLSPQLAGLSGEIYRGAFTRDQIDEGHPNWDKMGSFAGFSEDGDMLVRRGIDPHNAPIPAGTRVS